MQFIDFEVGVEADIKENDEVNDNSGLDSLLSFIDNEERERKRCKFLSIMLKPILMKHEKTNMKRVYKILKISTKFLIYVKVQRRNQKLMILIIQQKK